MSEHYITKKAWGTCTNIFKNSNVQVDMLDIVAGGYCSLHKHRAKFNLFLVLEGDLDVCLYLLEGKENHLLQVGTPRFIINPGIHHNFDSQNGCKAIEISFVKLNDNDIVRMSESGVRD